jgi:hypothetical protein
MLEVNFLTMQISNYYKLHYLLDLYSKHKENGYKNFTYA